MASLPKSQQQRERRIGRQSAWPDLPPELLGRIVGVLSPLNRVAVRLVCASWRACVREFFPTDLPFEAPRLLLRRPGPGGGLAFFSLQHRKILSFTLPASLGAAGRCCGHLGGWLAMASDGDRSILLCNPVSGRSVALPPPPVFPVAKVVLSGPPSSGKSWVAAAVGRTGTIVLFQPGSAWMTMGLKEGRQHGGFRDLAFWRGRLCALGHDGAVLAFRGDLRVSLLRDADHAVGASVHWRAHLVEGDGELLVVRKLYVMRRNSDVAVLEVEVHALASAAERRWEVVEEMPGRAVFVGSVVSATVPASAGLRESCVYFARRQVEMLAPHAICEYSMVDDEMRTVPIAGGHSADVEPVWITPFV